MASQYRQNAHNQRNNPRYWYQSIDILYISQMFLREPALGGWNISSPLGSEGNLTLENLFSRTIQNYLNNRQPTFIPLNLQNIHWVLLTLIPNQTETIAFYIDSYGEHKFKSERELFQTKLSSVGITTFLYNRMNFQDEDSSHCGIFTLQNMRVIAENQKPLADIDKFVNWFEHRNFTRLRTAQSLRKTEFPELYLEGQKQDDELRKIIRVHHHPECQAIKDILNRGDWRDVTIEIYQASLESNIPKARTISIDIALPSMLTQNYQHNYRIEFTRDLLNESIQEKIREVLNIQGEPTIDNVVEISYDQLNIEKQDPFPFQNYIQQQEALRRSESSQNDNHSPPRVSEEEMRQFLASNLSYLSEKVNEDKLRDAIQSHDVQEVKALLKKGLKINSGCSYEDTRNVSFLTVLEYEEQRNPGKEDLQKIRKLLRKYGCQKKPSDKVSFIRKFVEKNLVLQLAKQNHCDEKLLNIFLDILKSSIKIVICGFQSAASEQLMLRHLHIAEVIEEHGVEHLAEYIKKMLEHGSEHLAEINFSLLAKLVFAYIKDLRNRQKAEHVRTNIRGLFPNNQISDNIVSDYCHGVLKYAAETICSAAKLPKEDQKYLAIIDKYTKEFVTFIMHGRAQDRKNPDIPLGVEMAEQLFEKYLVKQQDFDEILTNSFSPKSVEAMAKLARYIEDVPECKRIFNWNFVSEIYLPKDPEFAKSVVLLGPEIVLICFNMKEKRSRKLIKHLEYNKFQDNPTPFFPITVIFNYISRKYQAASIFLVSATKYGTKFARWCREKLVENDEISPEKIHLYLFEETKGLPEEDTLQIHFHQLDAKEYLKKYLNKSYLLNGAPVAQIRLSKENSKKYRYKTAFQLQDIIDAINSDDLDLLKFLLEEKKLDVNKKDKTNPKRYTPLLYALKKQNPNQEIIEYLILKGADVNCHASERSDVSPLKAAAKYKHLNILNYLIDKGAQIDFLGTNETPLCAAVESGDLDLVKRLVNKGANLNGYCSVYRGLFPSASTPSKNNYSSALFAAVQANSLEIVKVLIDKGADANFLNPWGNTPLFYAKSVPIAKYLTENGADIHHINIQSQTPVDFMISQNLSLPVIKFIVEKGSLQMDTIRKLSQGNENSISISQFLTLLKLKERVLTFDEYQQIFNLIVVELGCPPYSFVSSFVSECLRLMKPDISPPYKKKPPLPETSRYFSQFFEGSHFLQAYNNALKLLLSYDSNRLTTIETICNQPDFASMDMFKTLKALAVLSRVGAHSSSLEERKTFLKESRKIIESFTPEGKNLAEYKYLKGEVLYAKQCYIEFNKDFDSAQSYYEDAGGPLNDDLDSLGYFTHPKARLIDILARKGKIEQVHKFSEALLNSQILPLDVESDIENSQERVRTKDFISNSNSRQNSLRQQESNDFNRGLREAFTIDILKTLEELKQTIPLALKEELQRICDKANYGYRILRKTKYTKKDPNLIASRDHKIFTQIKEVIEGLENLKDKTDSRASAPSFFKDDDERRKLQVQNSLSSALKYYENYIQDVIQDSQTQNDLDYLQKLCSHRAKLLDVNKHIKVQTEDGQRYLLKHLAGEKIRVQGPPKDIKYGTHQVTVYPPNKQHSVYYKYFPYAPGIQYAVTTLSQEIVPNSAAETMLLRVSDKTGSAIYLASKGVPGRNFSEVIDQQEYIQKLDIDNFSGLFISSLLTRPGDAKPDNFIMIFFTDSNGLKYTQLVSIDDDIAFCSSRLNINHPTVGNRNRRIVYADMLNILYLMPQMDKPVSQAVKIMLLTQKPALMVAQWLQKLYHKNLTFEKFLTIPEIDSVRLPIQLPPSTASKIYSRLLEMQNFARTQPMMTHDDYFRTFCPGIWNFYKMSRDNLSMMVSLKNLYAAAGADPNLVESLCSRNRAISSQAMIGVSASKRMNLKEFKTKFSSSLRKEAEKLLSTINFKTLNDQDVRDLSQTLRWEIPNDPKPLTFDLELDSINSTQIQIIYDILQPRRIKLTNPVDATKCRELLERWYGESPDHLAWRNSMSASFIHRTALNLTNLQDLFKRRQSLNENELTPENLLTVIIQNSWDINARDILSGDTLLHKAVRRNDLHLVRLLLDCGIDDELRNFDDDDKASDICSHPDIERLLIYHHPKFFLDCIEANEIKMALNIAKSISQTRLCQFGSDMQKALHLIFQRYQQQAPNENSKELAKILLQKIDKVLDLTLINTCAINSRDSDTDLLNLLLNKFQVKSLQYRPQCRELYEAVENARQNRKFKTLVLLINKGIQFEPQNDNDRVLLIAAKWGLKIEVADLDDEKASFRYDKIHLETGNTLFHLMCLHNQDPDALFIFEKYESVLQDYYSIKNNDQQTLFDLAKEYDFIKLLEKMYPNPNHDSMYNRNGAHILAKNSKMCEITRLCKRYKLDLSISDIIDGFDLDKKVDTKGNTLYQKMTKYSLALGYDEQLCETGHLTRKDLQNDLSCLLIYKPSLVANRKGNTILHLIARANDPRPAYLFAEKASLSSLQAENSQGQTCLDIAELYGHEDTARTFKNRIKVLKRESASYPASF